MNIINRAEFDKIFRTYAAICNRILIDEITNFYYNSLKNVQINELKNAIHVFASQNKFASVAEILMECGYQKPLTQEELRELPRQKEPDQNIIPSYESEFGEFVFQLFSEQKTKETAEVDFEKQVQDKLVKNDWKILHITLEGEGALQKIEGKLIKKIPVFIKNYLCYRNNNGVKRQNELVT